MGIESEAVMSVAITWGTTPEERSFSFPCEHYLERFDATYYRGVTIEAPASVVFRWLCQMRIAPYSYDWLDNFGRRSPRTLTPGVERLVPGETTMMGRWRFELLDFDRDRQITMRHRTRLFGETLLAYVIATQSTEKCRLLVKVLMRYPAGPIGWLERLFLPWGDLIMMRRQLLNFKTLAERTASNPV